MPTLIIVGSEGEGIEQNIIRKDELIIRIAKTIPDESKLVKKVVQQVKNARKRPRIHLNINEKQLLVHLSEVIKK